MTPEAATAAALVFDICASIDRLFRTRQWWTTDRLATLAPPRETRVSVLVGEHTFSSVEALAYHLQSQGRARVVG